MSPLGLGHAILQAKEAVGKEPFAVVLADDLIDAKQGVLQQMLDRYEDENSSIVSVQKIKKSESVNYGIIEFKGIQMHLLKLQILLKNLYQKMHPQVLVL